jgi:flagellar biosynthesis/type III secretory pathway protein FliH
MIRFKIRQNDSIRFKIEKASYVEGGYSKGYAAGYDAGYNRGYEEGYNAGSQQQTAILGKAVLGKMKLA